MTLAQQIIISEMVRIAMVGLKREQIIDSTLEMVRMFALEMVTAIQMEPA